MALHVPGMKFGHDFFLGLPKVSFRLKMAQTDMSPFFVLPLAFCKFRPIAVVLSFLHVTHRDGQN